MNYIFKITDNKAELITQAESFDTILTQDTCPACEHQENTHPVLAYNTKDGIHWEHIPYTPAELRKRAYETEKAVEWNGDTHTVDELNDAYLKYSAEGNDKAGELSIIISSAKEDIRARYPDTE